MAKLQSIAMTHRGLVGLLLFSLLGCAPAPTPVAPAPTVAKKEPVVEPTISTDIAALCQRMDSAIEHVRNRDLLTTNAFWTIFHGILCFGPGTSLTDAKGETVNAVDYILGGNYDRGQIRGLRFIPTKDGLDLQMGPTHVGQGHQDQFIAKLATWDVPGERELSVFGKTYTLMDIVREAQAHARIGDELSWSNIAIGKYVGTEAEWTNNAGQKLQFADLIQSELDASVNDAACGGCHRLNGLAMCLFMNRRQGRSDDGVWQAVQKKLDDHIRIAKDHQFPDGRFSTSYFREKALNPDIQLQLGSSGHIFELMATILPKEELTAPWMLKAGWRLCELFLEVEATAVESGALYHACHGLTIYRHRVAGANKIDTN